MKPSFFLDNPQTSPLYGHTVLEWFAGSKLKTKWPFLLELVRDGSAGIYDSGKRSIPLPPTKKWRKLKSFLEKAEFNLWLILHGINPRKVKVIQDLKELSKDDTLFSFLHGRFDHPETSDFEDFSRCEAKKVAHVSHYNFYPEIIRSALEKAKVDFFVGESDLVAHSPFFAHCFPNSMAPFEVIPFGFAKRFVKKAIWKDRISKCVATGTFQKVNAERDGCVSYVKFFNTDTLHTLRRTIHENRDKLSSSLDSRMSDLDAEVQKSKTALPEYGGKTFVTKLYRYIKRLYLADMLPHHGRRAYYNFNIVDLYNSYKMFVVPEEMIGLPAIGFVEGMACGAAYIGQDHSMYRDIGLIPGIHYIGYDGSLTDLQLKVEYYLANDHELEEIARAGHEYVVSNFTADNVRALFYKKLVQR